MHMHSAHTYLPTSPFRSSPNIYVLSAHTHAMVPSAYKPVSPRILNTYSPSWFSVTSGKFYTKLQGLGVSKSNIHVGNAHTQHHIVIDIFSHTTIYLLAKTTWDSLEYTGAQCTHSQPWCPVRCLAPLVHSCSSQKLPPLELSKIYTCTVHITTNPSPH